MADFSHAEAILGVLDQVKCINCGRQAVRGSRICLDCARSLPSADLARVALGSPVGAEGSTARPDVGRGAS